MVPDGWITITEATERTGYGKSWIHKLVQDKRLKARKVGPIWTINAKALDAFMSLERSPGRPAKQRRRKASF